MTAQKSEVGGKVTRVARTQDPDGAQSALEVIVEEPVAIVFNGTTAAVMMATPSDVRDLASGFALSEGHIGALSDIESYEEVRHAKGVEARFWLTEARAEAVAARRRAMAGPVGCGLCGIESLEEVRRPLPKVTARSVLAPRDILSAMVALRDWQPLKSATRSTHAAGFYQPGTGILAAREDVGRHNALDKLIGHLAQTGVDGSAGAVVMTSRISLELVQKCAMLSAPLLIAPSGPTSLAIDVAQDCGIALIGFCREGSFQRFS